MPHSVDESVDIRIYLVANPPIKVICLDTIEIRYTAFADVGGVMIFLKLPIVQTQQLNESLLCDIIKFPAIFYVAYLTSFTQFESSTLPPNSAIGLVPPALSKTTVSSVPYLINDDPVTDDLHQWNLQIYNYY
ncbi:MAG: hypothetical protein EZS28_005780 [Streblomastix strix]|uniref:Uncharacterized protein n=1 Tax=Streblomastix strix TaxID=222440 RepID=A0A5J4WUY6_9EUKA|nr:MAG: hypothetical protein EZS28_005780 [Streblomastix strix]